MTEWGKGRFVGAEEYLSRQLKDWIPEGSDFTLLAMGDGHFYLEREHIYYNSSCRKSFCDGAIAEWKE